MMLIRHFYNEKLKQEARLCHVNLNKFINLLASFDLVKKRPMAKKRTCDETWETTKLAEFCVFVFLKNHCSYYLKKLDWLLYEALKGGVRLCKKI